MKNRKKVKIFSSISELEEFVNSVDVIDVSVTGCEQSYYFQECFIGVVFYNDTRDTQQENQDDIKNRLVQDGNMSRCEDFEECSVYNKGHAGCYSSVICYTSPKDGD